MVTTSRTHPLQDVRLAAGLALAATAGGLAFANFGGAETENGGPAEYAAGVAVCALVAALLFARTLPRAAAPAKAAWWLAGGAVLTLAIFWSGLPIVLGVAAMHAGARGGAPAPAALGALAAVAALVACVAG